MVQEIEASLRRLVESLYPGAAPLRAWRLECGT